MPIAHVVMSYGVCMCIYIYIYIHIPQGPSAQMFGLDALQTMQTHADTWVCRVMQDNPSRKSLSASASSD